MSVGDIDNENERRVLGEFIDELRDAASGMQVLVGNLRSRSQPLDKGLLTLKRFSSSMCTQAQGLPLPLLKMLTSRLEEYIADVPSLTDAILQDIEVYLDALEEVANAGEAEAEKDVDLPSIARSLPSRHTFDMSDPVKKDVEVLLVIPEKAMSHIVERELQSCGYRSYKVRDSFQAIETIIHTRPNMVIAAMELGAWSGVDLGCALEAISVTKKVPFALLTSYQPGHAKLVGLPAGAMILRKGPGFGKDLAESFAKFGLS